MSALGRSASATRWERRRFLVSLAGLTAAGCACKAAAPSRGAALPFRLPWQPPRPPRVGYLTIGESGPPMSEFVDAFRQGLADLGYAEGADLLVEYRYAAMQRERLPELAADLVDAGVDTIVVGDSVAIPYVMAATSTVPIIMAISGDPVADGYVASYAHPGGNVTGLSNLSPELAGKRVELLRDAVPSLSRLGIVAFPAPGSEGRQLVETEAAARALGLAAVVLEVRSAADLDAALEAALAARVDGLAMLPNPVINAQTPRIVRFALEQRLPTMFAVRENVERGGLMSYGPNRFAMYRRAAAYVDKILKGAQPGDLPIERPNRFDLVINLKTADAIGLQLPEFLRAEATDLIY